MMSYSWCRVVLCWASLGAVGCGSVALSPDAAMTDDAGEVISPDAGQAPAADGAAGSEDARVPSLPVDAGTAASDAPTAPSDGPGPGACSEPRDLVGGAPVYSAQIARFRDGLVVAWAAGGRTGIQAQAFDNALNPRGFPVTLGWLGSQEGVTLSMDFAAESGAIAVGSSLYLVAANPDGALRTTATVALGAHTARAVWAQSDTMFHVVMSDGRYVYTNGARVNANTPNEPLNPPYGPDVSIVFQSSGYTSFVQQPNRCGSRLHMRRFIFGHGASLQVASEYAEGADAALVAADDRSVYRLLQRGGREVSLDLEQRSLQDLRLESRLRVVHENTAWNATHGALSLHGTAPLLAWAARPEGGGYNSAVRAAWGAGSDAAVIYRDPRDEPVHVHGVTADRALRRGWVIFGVERSNSPHRLMAQCVTQNP